MLNRLFLSLFLFTTAYSQNSNVFVGGGVVTTFHAPYTDLIIKGTHNHVQGSFFYHKNIFYRDFEMGFQIGYNFYNKNGTLIGSNICFSRYISFPSLNIMQAVSNRFSFDLNFRPSYNFFQAEIAILYRLNKD